jgi:hypothetical protein
MRNQSVRFKAMRLTPTERDNQILRNAGYTWSRGKYSSPHFWIKNVNRRVALFTAYRRGAGFIDSNVNPSK